jgi:hypothetical protein
MLVLSLGEIGTDLRARFYASAVREKAKKALEHNEQVVFDFDRVEEVTSSFADECFGKLVLDIRPEIISKSISYRNTSPYFKAIFQKALKERMLQLEESL